MALRNRNKKSINLKEYYKLDIEGEKNMKENNQKTFVIVGASGYIAKRHIESISKVNGNLLAVYDPSDQIGIIDSFFDNTKFFNDFFFFDNWMKDNKKRVDYFVICTPNYTHYFYIKYGLKHECNIICEKPLVIRYERIEEIIQLSKKVNRNVYPILQARIHPKIIKLKKYIEKNKNKECTVSCLYMSKRSGWYDNSWKGTLLKSGGVLMNIGIHLFDTLFYVFGHDLVKSKISEYNDRYVMGKLQIGKAEINFHVSVNKSDIPEGVKVLREIMINDQVIEFSDGFSELHPVIYKKIIEGDWNIDIKELEDPIKESCLIIY